MSDFAAALPTGVTRNNQFDSTTILSSINDNILKLTDFMTGDSRSSKSNIPDSMDEDDIQVSNKKQNELLDKISKNTETLRKSGFEFLYKGLLGPFRLITEPLEKLGGWDFEKGIADGLGKGTKKLFGLFFGDKKVPPKRSQMLKTHPEAVYMVDELLGKTKKDKGLLDKISGLFNLGPGFLTGAIPGLVKGMGKIAPFMAIGAAIGLMIKDGIEASKLAKEWGVSKLSAVIGGVLGGTKEGLEGAFSNMGKWALLGAGAGTLIAPGLGTLVGGLIGAAFGGILGWIGGENIAEIVEKIRNFFKDPEKELTNEYETQLKEFREKHKDSKRDKNGKLIDAVARAQEESLENTTKYLKEGGETLTTSYGKKYGFFGKLWGAFNDWYNAQGKKILNSLPSKYPLAYKLANSWYKADAVIGTSLGAGFGLIGDFFVMGSTWVKDSVIKLGEGIGKFFGTLKDKVKDFFKPMTDKIQSFMDSENKWEWIKDEFKGLGEKIFGGITDKINAYLKLDEKWEWVKDEVDKLISGIMGFVNSIFSFFDYAGDVMGKEGITGLITLGKDTATGFKGHKDWNIQKSALEKMGVDYDENVLKKMEELKEKYPTLTQDVLGNNTITTELMVKYLKAIADSVTTTTPANPIVLTNGTEIRNTNNVYSTVPLPP